MLVLLRIFHVTKKKLLLSRTQGLLLFHLVAVRELELFEHLIARIGANIIVIDSYLKDLMKDIMNVVQCRDFHALSVNEPVIEPFHVRL